MNLVKIRKKHLLIVLLVLIVLAIGFIKWTGSSRSTSTDSPPINSNDKQVNTNRTANVNQNRAVYNLSLEMNESKEFHTKAKIQVENLSEDAWDKIVFYMIPNMFTKENKPDVVDQAGSLQIVQVAVGGQPVPYQLQQDTLTVPLQSSLQPKSKLDVDVTYVCKLPENGVRFTKFEESYYLAQWYPMLATYKNGWNKNEYLVLSESYHTDFSDFTMSYKIPTGYTLINFSNNAPLNSTEGTFEAKNIKELFVAITKDLTAVSKMAEGVEVRVWGRSQAIANQHLDTAASVFSYYHTNIGPYPHKRFDVILDSGGMEYPGMVIVDPSDDVVKHTLVHEIAHQWFYGTVSNDPFTNGWLDEGLAELSGSLYLFDHDKNSVDQSLEWSKRFQSMAVQRGIHKPSNLPISEYKDSGVAAFLYAQPTLKLWDLFEKHGGAKTGIKFLHDYYKTYEFKEVDTQEFVQFTKKYFQIDDTLFQDWLKLK